MKLAQHGMGQRRKPPAPDAPTVEILFGADEGANLGVIRVEVPAGAGMPEHGHGGSDVIVMPTTGSIVMSQGDNEVAVNPGDAVLVPKDETVALRNPGNEVVHVLVAASPTNFLENVANWPAVSDSELTNAQ